MVLHTYQDPTLGKEKRTVADWSKLAIGQMKFNIDETASGCGDRVSVER